MEKFIKISIKRFGFNPVFCVSLPRYTRQRGLKSSGINLQTLQVEDMILLLETNTRGGTSSVMCDRYAVSDVNKKIKYVDANKFYGHSLSQYLPYDEIKYEKKVKLADILSTPEDSDYGCFVEVDLK